MLNLKPRRPWEDEEVAMFRSAARRFIEQEAVPRDAQWRRQKFVDREFWHQAAKVGLLCPSMPLEVGGGGGDFRMEAVVSEELAFAGLSSFTQAVHGGIVAPYILHYGNAEQQQRWLPRMASGEFIGAIAMTEPSGGSDLQSLRTTAVREGGHYRLNGAKTFITSGQMADLIIVAAKTNPSLGAKGVSLIVVETADLPGFRRGKSLEKIGMHGSDTAELFFEDVKVPMENLLGGHEGQGFVQLMQQLPQERLSIAVSAQAAVECAIDITTAYVNERQAFGQRLRDFQNTRFKLAECLAAAKVTRSFIDDCISRHIRGELDSTDASIAKLWCTELQCKVVDECVQLHGGYGYMEEVLIARMYADARVQRIYGGSNEVMKELIARSLTGGKRPQ